MKTKSKLMCELEQSVYEELSKGSLSKDIAGHVSHCKSCSDFEMIYQWMDDFKRTSIEYEDREIQLPTAEMVWQTALIPRRTNPVVIKKVMRLLFVPRFLTFAFVVIGLIAAFVGDKTGIRSILGDYFDFGFLSVFFSGFFKMSAFVTVPFILLAVFMMIYPLFIILSPEES